MLASLTFILQMTVLSQQQDFERASVQPSVRLVIVEPMPDRPAGIRLESVGLGPANIREVAYSVEEEKRRDADHLVAADFHSGSPPLVDGPVYRAIFQAGGSHFYVPGQGEWLIRVHPDHIPNRDAFIDFLLHRLDIQVDYCSMYEDSFPNECWRTCLHDHCTTGRRQP
ncbi:MAG: hypothetical protein GVY13_19830 [Alphaproteobacteria bacterium]|nr:hypothetical protein [Alphaproteobacteria bacterium]